MVYHSGARNLTDEINKVFDDAVETYRRLQDGGLKAVSVLFRYPQPEGEAEEAAAPAVTVPVVEVKVAPGMSL